jgi:hypothetical protein
MADDLDPPMSLDVETPTIPPSPVKGSSTKAEPRGHCYVDPRLKERLAGIKFPEKTIIDEAVLNWMLMFTNSVRNSPGTLVLSPTWSTFDSAAKSMQESKDESKKISPATLARIAARIMSAILQSKAPNQANATLFSVLRDRAAAEGTDIYEVIVRLITIGLEAEKTKKPNRNRR